MSTKIQTVSISTVVETQEDGRNTAGLINLNISGLTSAFWDLFFSIIIHRPPSLHFLAPFGVQGLILGRWEYTTSLTYGPHQGHINASKAITYQTWLLVPAEIVSEIFEKRLWNPLIQTCWKSYISSPDVPDLGRLIYDTGLPVWQQIFRKPFQYHTSLFPIRSRNPPPNGPPRPGRSGF